MRELGCGLEQELIMQYVIRGIEDDEINKVMLYGRKPGRDFSDKLDLYDLIKNNFWRCCNLTTTSPKIETPENSSLFSKNVHQNQTGPNNWSNRYNQPNRSSDSGLNRYRTTNQRYHPYNKPQQSRLCFRCNSAEHFANNCPK